nr:MAG: replication initiator protein [Microvirus sp.]
MQCVNPFLITKHIDLEKHPEGYISVPCGKCLQCKMSRSREWASRIMHEVPYWTNPLFVTLTYDDKNLPHNSSLKKRDLQLFFKRFRKSLKTKIKYYACGEYGEKALRPHYHLILFTDEKELPLSSSWGKGLYHVGQVTYESARYVAQYINKKYYGDLAETTYTNKKLESPFQVQSQGIGLRYALDNTLQLVNQLYITNRGIKTQLPRYYVNKLKINKEPLIEMVQQKQAETQLNYIKKGLTDYISIRNAIKKAREQNEMSLSAKIGLFNAKNRKL